MSVWPLFLSFPGRAVYSIETGEVRTDIIGMVADVYAKYEREKELIPLTLTDFLKSLAGFAEFSPRSKITSIFTLSGKH